MSDQEASLRFYNHDSDGYWKQCRYCAAYVQLWIDGKPTGNTISHKLPCPVYELEQLAAAGAVEGETQEQCLRRDKSI